MAESDYAGIDSFDTPKVAENGDGTSTFWENSFKRLVNRTKFLRLNAYQCAPAVVLADTAQVIVPTLPYTLYICSTPAANRVLSLTNSLPHVREGTRVCIVRPAAGAFTITIDNEINSGGHLVVLPSAAWDYAALQFSETTIGWRLIGTKAGTAGADA